MSGEPTAETAVVDLVVDRDTWDTAYFTRNPRVEVYVRPRFAEAGERTPLTVVHRASDGTFTRRPFRHGRGLRAVRR